jgi:hypothetical protein
LVAKSEQIGPSFDCYAAQQPLAQMLCADPELARTDLLFAQAYFALLKQVGEAGKRELKEEDLRFLEAVQRQCGIPQSGQAVPQSEAARNCVKKAYEAQRTVWALRLTPPFSEEANRPIEQHVTLQRALQKLGFLPTDAVMDGVYGAGTREAISQWQRSQTRNATGVLGDADALALKQQSSQPGQETVGAGGQAKAPEAVAPQKPSAVPVQGSRSGAVTQAAATQNEKLTVDMGNVNSVTAQELEHCVVGFTDIVLDLLSLGSARCVDAFPLVRIQAIDSRENGPQVEVLTELTFRVLEDLPKDAMFVAKCTTFNWKQDLKKGGSVVLTKAVNFDKWSHQSICNTRSLAPALKGVSTNP